MMKKKARFVFFFALLIAGIAGFSADLRAQEKRQVGEKFHVTSLPLPRFVSLGEEKIHVRAGPGQKYPIKWVYEKRGLPVEIVLEFENWRKIKDREGAEGWVYHTLLSGKRRALIESKEQVTAYRTPFNTGDEKSSINLYLEPSVVVSLEKCQPFWCRIESSGYKGWVERKYLWGVYENENFD